MSNTPNILFIATEEINPPSEAEVLITDSKMHDDKPRITGTGSLFGNINMEIEYNTVSPHLEYPLSMKMVIPTSGMV